VKNSDGSVKKNAKGEIEECKTCPDNCDKCSEENTCNECAPGFAKPVIPLADTSKTCVLCQDYKSFLKPGAQTCTECPAHCKTCTDENTCVECVEGYDKNGEGRCVKCGADEYFDDVGKECK
jgi:proprotein convertase subtilisin/kexin type 5